MIVLSRGLLTHETKGLWYIKRINKKHENVICAKIDEECILAYFFTLAQKVQWTLV